MSSSAHIYCLDANVLIQTWQKWPHLKFVPTIGILELGKQGRIFIAERVKNEIVVTDDKGKKKTTFQKWLKRSSIPVHKPTENVIKCWQNTIQANPFT